LLYQSIKIAPACNKVAPYGTIIVPRGTKIAMSETKIELLGTKVALQGITIEYACTKVALARGKQGAVVEGLAGSIPYLFLDGLLVGKIGIGEKTRTKEMRKIWSGCH
jgi:hypothetical protein